jgi:hypothetical protein
VSEQPTSKKLSTEEIASLYNMLRPYPSESQVTECLKELLEHRAAHEPRAIHTVGQLGEAIEPVLKALTIEGNEPYQLTVLFKHNEDGSIGLLNAQYIAVSNLESSPDSRCRCYATLRVPFCPIHGDAASAQPPPVVHDRPLSAVQRLHNICDALREQADESPFTREEWDRVDKQTVEQQQRIRELEAEVSTLREHLAEVNRLMSLNCRTVERLEAENGGLHAALDQMGRVREGDGLPSPEKLRHVHISGICMPGCPACSTATKGGE